MHDLGFDFVQPNPRHVTNANANAKPTRNCMRGILVEESRHVYSITTQQLVRLVASGYRRRAARSRVSRSERSSSVGVNVAGLQRTNALIEKPRFPPAIA